MLQVRSLRKAYGRTEALLGVDIDVACGAILGIAGPNGAGKSTLVRLLAGEEAPDDGEMTFKGKPLIQSTEFRVAVVHQEPQLFPNLTVEQNLLVGNEQTRWRWPRSRRAVGLVLDDLDLKRFEKSSLGTLPLAVQQRTEIARAVSRNAQIFLFDEPNSALTEDESTNLFDWMHRLADRGAAVLFITHRLTELVEHAGSVVVIRDGRVVSRQAESLSQEQIARALVSEEPRAVEDGATPTRVSDDSYVRLVDWRSRRGQFSVPEFRFRSGEVVAVVGVEGSGGREFVASLAGFEPVHGRAEMSMSRDRSRFRHRAQYLPASRSASLFQNLSLAENTVARLGRGTIASRFGLLRPRQVRRFGESARNRHAIASRSAGQQVSSLSGGNQQKVAIAATLASDPQIVAVEEPTRGVDVGSRAEIHRVLRDYAREGALVAAFCTEVSEVLQLADTVYVMDAGRLSPPLDVHAYDDAPSLAADISALERHAR